MHTANNFPENLHTDSYNHTHHEQAPFRFTRMFVAGGVAVGAALGLFITTSRLLLAFQGGEGAPDLTESLTNFGVNAGVLTLAGVLLYRDNKAKEKSVEVTDREELLSRLQVRDGPIVSMEAMSYHHNLASMSCCE